MVLLSGVVAFVLGAFTVYAGVAMAVALFHPDARRRRRAAVMFRQVLHAIFPRRAR